MALSRQDLRGISLSTDFMLTKVLSGRSRVLKYVLGAIVHVNALLIGTISTCTGAVDVSMDEWWWQNNAGNDVLNERYEKHGNFVSGRT